VGGNKPWDITFVVNKPSSADVQHASVGRLQKPVNDVSSSKTGSFFEGNFVVNRVLPKRPIEIFPAVGRETKLHKKAALLFPARSVVDNRYRTILVSPTVAFSTPGSFIRERQFLRVPI
jgi:hypothetical protein